MYFSQLRKASLLPPQITISAKGYVGHRKLQDFISSRNSATNCCNACYSALHRYSAFLNGLISETPESFVQVSRGVSTSTLTTLKPLSPRRAVSLTSRHLQIHAVSNIARAIISMTHAEKIWKHATISFQIRIWNDDEIDRACQSRLMTCVWLSTSKEAVLRIRNLTFWCKESRPRVSARPWSQRRREWSQFQLLKA